MIRLIHPTRYLRPERSIPINEIFRSQALKAIGNKKDNMERGRALYHYTLEYLEYDKTGTGWGEANASHACNSRAGNCTDFHAFFIALARSVGIPARFAIGVSIPANKEKGQTDGYHCWAEFFADGRWIPIDISEAWKRPEFTDYYFGHHPANRIEISHGQDLIIQPSPQAGVVNFFAYPILEVDGKEVKTKTEFLYRRIRPSK